MAVYQRFINLDTMFFNSNSNKIVLNDMSFTSGTDRALINELIQTKYDTNINITLVPMCGCGNKKGAYNLGVKCEICGDNVKETFGKTEPLLWFKAIPECGKFISPHFWQMTVREISTKEDMFLWIGNPRYVPISKPVVFSYLENMPGFERSYSFLVNNMVKILTFVSNHSSMNTNNRNNIIPIIKLWKLHKDQILSEYMPIPNKKLFVVENTSKGTYTNPILGSLLNTVYSFIAAVNNKAKTKKGCEVTATAIHGISNVYSSYYRDIISKKYGAFRKHVYGSRSHFTARAVITSMPGPHDLNSLIFPWGIMVTLFRPHLLNILKSMGYRYKKASALLFESVTMYNEVIDEALTKMMKMAGKNRLWSIIQRNPSIQQGSALWMPVVDFKRNVKDTTVTISGMAVPLLRGDFDGDECNLTLLLDNEITQEFKTLSPHHNVPDASHPYAISSAITLTKPTIATISNYLTDDKKGNGDLNSLPFRKVKI